MRSTIIAISATIIASVALLIIGMSQAAAGALLSSLLCGLPLLAFLIGRLSMMIEIVPRERERVSRRRASEQKQSQVLG